MSAATQNALIVPEETRDRITRALLLALDSIALIASLANSADEMATTSLNQLVDHTQLMYPQGPRSGLEDLQRLAADFGLPLTIGSIPEGASKHVH